MKLFISKEVLKNIGEKVDLKPLDLNRSEMTIFNVCQKKDGRKEITPFNFIFPVSSLVLEHSKGNVLINIHGVRLTHKDESKLEPQSDNLIYAMFYKGKMAPGEIYVPVEQKDKINVLYNIQNQEESFYIICFNLNKGDSVPVYLAYEAQFWVQKVLYFECSSNIGLSVQEYNTCFMVDDKNRVLYRPLYTLGGRLID